jgi:hypothetical protein
VAEKVRQKNAAEKVRKITKKSQKTCDRKIVQKKKITTEKAQKKKHASRTRQQNRGSRTNNKINQRQLMVFGLWRVWCISRGILLVILVILLRVVLVIDLGE